jgi:hypothetical protein
MFIGRRFHRRQARACALRLSAVKLNYLNRSKLLLRQLRLTAARYRKFERVNDSIISLDNTIMWRKYCKYDYWIQIKRHRKDLEWIYVIETANRYSKSSQKKNENAK